MEKINVTDDTLDRYWVLVADSSKARLLRGASPRSDFKEFETLENEDARKDGKEIDTDGPGSRRDVGPAGPGAPSTGQRSAMPADPVEQAKRDFAGDVADWLDTQRGKDAFDTLAIIASPQFLGDLRKNMPKSLQSKVSVEVNKNLVGMKPDAIGEHLRKHLD